MQAVVGAAFPGAVVDMHDAGGDRSETVAALPQIITQLRGEGLLVRLDLWGNAGAPGDGDLWLRQRADARIAR